jgi:hypothetical protein
MTPVQELRAAMERCWLQQEELGAVEALDFVEEVYHCILYQTDDSK